MEQPPRYVQNNSNLVCIVKKSLYGLKQAPRDWCAKMDSFLIDTIFSRCHSDPNVYTKKLGNHIIILVLYVDDIILTSSDPKLLTHVKSSLKKNFEMSNLGHLHYFLGLQVLQGQRRNLSFLDLLRHFHMEDFKPAPSPFQFGVKLSATCTSLEVDATLYCQLVGSLLYLTHSRRELSFVIGRVSRYMQPPMKVTRKKQKEYFDIFEVQFSLGFITVQRGNLCWLVSLIQIRLVILMIETLLQVMFLV